MGNSPHPETEPVLTPASRLVTRPSGIPCTWPGIWNSGGDTQLTLTLLIGFHATTQFKHEVVSSLQPNVDEMSVSFHSAQNTVTIYHSCPLLSSHAVRPQTSPMGRAGSDWNARTKGSVANQSRLVSIRARTMPFPTPGHQSTHAGGSLDADLQNTLVPTIGPHIPDKVCLSSYLTNVMRLCSLSLTPAAKLLNVLERSIVFAAYIFSVVTTSRVQNPHIKVVTGSRFTNTKASGN